MKYVTIGRHNFTDLQKRLLEKAGLTEEVARIEHVENPEEIPRIAREKGAVAIVVQGLPLPLLARLLQAAARLGIPVYNFHIEAVGLAESEEEAKRLAAEKGADILSPSREGKWRVSRTRALQRVVRILVETVPVATVEELGGVGERVAAEGTV